MKVKVESATLPEFFTSGEVRGQRIFGAQLSDGGVLLGPSEIVGSAETDIGLVRFTAKLGTNRTYGITEVSLAAPPAGPYIRSDAIRGISLFELLSQAIELVSIRIEEPFASARADEDTNDDGQPFKLPKQGDGKFVLRRRTRRVGDDQLVEAANAYRDAVIEGRTDLVMAVADACSWSKSTAHRRIQAARVAGHLSEDE